MRILTIVKATSSYCYLFLLFLLKGLYCYFYYIWSIIPKCLSVFHTSLSIIEFQVSMTALKSLIVLNYKPIRDLILIED